MAKDYLIFEIDTDRMKNGAAVGERLTKGQRKGYPWMTILDAEAKELVNGDGPGGNVGCPVTEEEAAWFFEMLDRSSQRLTAEDMKVLRAEHAAFAEPFRQRVGR